MAWELLEMVSTMGVILLSFISHYSIKPMEQGVSY